MNTFLRSASVLALFAAALVAQAVDAFSNLAPDPRVYQRFVGYSVAAGRTEGIRFTSSATGVLSGFQVAMNNAAGPGMLGYTVDLYSNGPSDTLGALMGSYSGTSTGQIVGTTSTALSTVVATGAPVAILSGQSYWASFRSDSPLVLGESLNGFGRSVFTPTGGDPTYLDNQRVGAFSVQVTPQATPEPSALAALGLGAVAMLRRRKRA